MRAPSPRDELAFPSECRKYLVVRARARGQSSSSRHWLVPITKSLTGLGCEKSLAKFLNRLSYQFKVVSSASNGVAGPNFSSPIFRMEAALKSIGSSL